MTSPANFQGMLNEVMGMLGQQNLQTMFQDVERELQKSEPVDMDELISGMTKKMLGGMGGMGGLGGETSGASPFAALLSEGGADAELSEGDVQTTRPNLYHEIRLTLDEAQRGVKRRFRVKRRAASGDIEPEVLVLDLPAGVTDGVQIIFAGKGDARKENDVPEESGDASLSPFGDVVVTLRVEATHSSETSAESSADATLRCSRGSADLHYELRFETREVFGATRRVMLPDGRPIEFRCGSAQKPLYYPGTWRVAGAGLQQLAASELQDALSQSTDVRISCAPECSQRGDLIVKAVPIRHEGDGDEVDDQSNRNEDALQTLLDDIRNASRTSYSKDTQADLVCATFVREA